MIKLWNKIVIWFLRFTNKTSIVDKRMEINNFRVGMSDLVKFLTPEDMHPVDNLIDLKFKCQSVMTPAEADKVLEDSFCDIEPISYKNQREALSEHNDKFSKFSKWKGGN